MNKNAKNLGKFYKPWTKEQIKQCLKLYKSGKTKTEVQKIMKVSERAVRKYLVLNGIEIRPCALTGNKNPSWKGGKTIDKNGYILLLVPDHPLKNSTGYVREHRLVMEKKLERYLLKNEVVDHINGITNDNRIENLCLFEKNSLHLKHTLKGKCPKWTEEGKKKITEAHKLWCISRHPISDDLV